MKKLATLNLILLKKRLKKFLNIKNQTPVPIRIPTTLFFQENHVMQELLQIIKKIPNTSTQNESVKEDKEFIVKTETVSKEKTEGTEKIVFNKKLEEIPKK